MGLTATFATQEATPAQLLELAVDVEATLVVGVLVVEGVETDMDVVDTDEVETVTGCDVVVPPPLSVIASLTCSSNRSLAVVCHDVSQSI